MNLSKINKTLIIRLSSLGDVLLTTPLIRSLKSTYPHLCIDFIVRSEYEDVVKHNSNISNIISIKRNYDVKSLREQIYKNKYDLIIF